MIDFINANIERVSAHYIGSKYEDEQLKLTNSEIKIEDQILRDLLFKYFTSNFKDLKLYTFSHSVSLEMNNVYTLISSYFKNEEFHDFSISLAELLYDKANHPNIKSGELYVTHLKGCKLNGVTVDTIGIFKSENKEFFIEVNKLTDDYELKYNEGVNINKLDKGCLVFKCEKETGYRVLIVDASNKKSEAVYWKDDFLGLKVYNDFNAQTENFINLYKSFVKNSNDKNEEIAKVDRIDLLNKTSNYLKDCDEFDIESFNNQVFETKETKKAFVDYMEEYQDENKIVIPNNFKISSEVVKNKSRSLKSVLKLDNNFHIYIHGDRSLIEQGMDSNSGKKYYKIYFEEEK